MLKQTALLVLAFALMTLPALARETYDPNGVPRRSVARCQTVRIVDATGIHWVRRCW